MPGAVPSTAVAGGEKKTTVAVRTSGTRASSTLGVCAETAS